jgi:hypothetical protein
LRIQPEDMKLEERGIGDTEMQDLALWRTKIKKRIRTQLQKTHVWRIRYSIRIQV